METKDFFQDKQKMINWQITFKVFIIGAIAIVLLIPKFMILGLINERQSTSEITNQEVMQKWSLRQTVRGPVLMIPYIERSFNTEGKELEEHVRTCYILPETLDISGEIFPEKRK